MDASPHSGTMTGGAIRALCHRFFDAIEQRDMGAVAALYHDDLAFWFNATGKTSGKTEMLAAMAAGAARHRRRTYNDRIVHTFPGGFVMQYTLNIVHHDGEQTALFPCVVALCQDGQILRMDEYIDSGKFKQPLPARTEIPA
ncbi:MAG: nuclear transport factor 2 family protein [Phenylobacterium sp.]|nr:nuclear transport factor 2 family protein [Phenylobacterium sp.]